MTLLARLLHGFGARDRIPSHNCCGRRWERYASHLGFAHGERVLANLPMLESLPCSEPGCANPASGWAYDLMGDGQTIGGRSVCVAHLAGVGE